MKTRHASCVAMAEMLERRSLFSASPMATQAVDFVVGVIVADPKRDLFYVNDVTHNKLLAVNSSTGTTAAAASLGASVRASVVSTDGSHLLVSEPAIKEIQEFALPGLSLVTTLQMPVPVYTFAQSAGGQIYGATGQQVEEFSSSGALLRPLAGANSYFYPQLSTSTDGKTLYVRNTQSASSAPTDVFDVSASIDVYRSTIATQTASDQNFAVSGDGAQIFTANEKKPGLDMTRTSNNAASFTAFAHGGEAAAVALTPAGSSVFAGSLGATPEIEEFSQSSHAVVNDYLLPRSTSGSGVWGVVSAALAVTPDGHALCVLSGQQTIALIGTASLNVTETPAVGGRVSGVVSGGPVGEMIYLDANNNSKLDVNEMVTNVSASHAYSIPNVPAGAYVIRQWLPAGYTQTLPAGGYGIHITVTNGSVFANENFTDVAATHTQLTGTTIGTAGSNKNGGNTIAKATDGSLTTFYDGAAANGNWVGLDLGSAKSISQIKFAPRSGYASRMTGGSFQISTTADFSSGVTTLYTISGTPASGSLTTVTLTSPVTARYVRYLSPTGSYGNIGEFQVFG